MNATSTKDLTREEWLLARCRGLGGSDIAAVAGLNPWKSPLGVYLDKIGEAPADTAGEAAYWGNILEDAVAREFAARTGFRVRRRNAILQHPEHPWMIANVDREVFTPEGRGILEVKTTSAFNARSWDEEDERLPEHVMLQVQWYLGVTGAAFAYVAVLIGGQHYLHLRVEPDYELIESLIAIGAEFWQQVEARTPPDIDASVACEQVLKALYPEDDGTELYLPEESRILIEQYHLAKTTQKTAEENTRYVGNRIRALMEEHEVAYLPGDERPAITYKTQTARRLDAKRLQAERPDVAAEYTTESTSRVLRVREAK